jgi:hypothetical protein
VKFLCVDSGADAGGGSGSGGGTKRPSPKSRMRLWSMTMGSGRNRSRLAHHPRGVRRVACSWRWEWIWLRRWRASHHDRGGGGGHCGDGRVPHFSCLDALLRPLMRQSYLLYDLFPALVVGLLDLECCFAFPPPPPPPSTFFSVGRVSVSSPSARKPSREKSFWDPFS